MAAIDEPYIGGSKTKKTTTLSPTVVQGVRAMGLFKNNANNTATSTQKATSTSTKPAGTAPGANATTVNISNVPKASSSGSGSKASVNSNSYSQSTVNNSATNALEALYEKQLAAQQESQNALAEQLRAQQERYEAQLRAQQEAQRQAAQNAYNSNMSALEEAYAKRLAGLDSNLASTKETLSSSYGNSKNALSSNAEKALQEAYINRMMNEKSLRQQLNAQGLNGGASESAVASLVNSYGNARNNINTTTADNLLSLEEAYMNNLASAQQKYNDAVSSAGDTNMAYKMQLENDLANNTVSSYANLYNALGNMDSNYTNAMTSLINNQAAANADLQNAALQAMFESSLLPATVSISGSANGATSDSVTNKVKKMYQNGYTAAQLLSELSDYSDEQIAQIFAEAGIPF